jgi:hypothetical protein
MPYLILLMAIEQQHIHRLQLRHIAMSLELLPYLCPDRRYWQAQGIHLFDFGGLCSASAPIRSMLPVSPCRHPKHPNSPYHTLLEVSRYSRETHTALIQSRYECSTRLFASGQLTAVGVSGVAEEREKEERTRPRPDGKIGRVDHCGRSFDLQEG